MQTHMNSQPMGTSGATSTGLISLVCQFQFKFLEVNLICLNIGQDYSKKKKKSKNKQKEYIVLIQSVTMWTQQLGVQEGKKSGC